MLWAQARCGWKRKRRVRALCPTSQVWVHSIVFASLKASLLAVRGDQRRLCVRAVQHAACACSSFAAPTQSTVLLGVAWALGIGMGILWWCWCECECGSGCWGIVRGVWVVTAHTLRPVHSAAMKLCCREACIATSGLYKPMRFWLDTARGCCRPTTAYCQPSLSLSFSLSLSVSLTHTHAQSQCGWLPVAKPTSSVSLPSKHLLGH